MRRSEELSHVSRQVRRGKSPEENSTGLVELASHSRLNSFGLALQRVSVVHEAAPESADQISKQEASGSQLLVLANMAAFVRDEREATR